MGCYNVTITSKNSGTFEAFLKVPAYLDRYIDKAYRFLLVLFQ
jgi:hypothetical protein